MDIRVHRVDDFDTNALGAAVKVLEERSESGVSPGLSYSLFDAAGIIAAGGYGDSGNHTVPGADTAFRIASCTKSFTAATALILRDRGLIDFDAPVTAYLRWLVGLQLPSPTSSVPTVRQLLSMSGGLSLDDAWADRQESKTSAELQNDANRGVKFESEPGSRFAYSNLGYAFLGQVIETVTQERYHEIVHDLLIRPLQLTSTGFSSEVNAIGGVATGYQWTLGSWSPVPFTEPGAFSAIGGLFSTARDLTRWAGWLAESHRHFGGTHDDVLSQASRREMQHVVQAIPVRAGAKRSASVDGYGFGLRTEYFEGRGWIASHSGGYPGFSSHMRWHSATGRGVVLLENATYVESSVPASAALDMLLDDVVESAVTPWAETLRAERLATSLIEAWDEERASALFAENVSLDESLAQRANHIGRAVEAVGGLARPVHPLQGSSNTPAHRSWVLAGHQGSLVCTVRLAPVFPFAVQSFEVRVAGVGSGERGL
ncbi:serine hydrolase domain-containing protein [Arthrobacter sp. RHLT1-20]